MSAQSLDVFTLDFTDPASDNPLERTRISSNVSYSLSLNDNIRTLSTTTVTNGADVEGLLYVPNLHRSDPCNEASALHVPDNVTRMSDLPSIQYSYIAFAPWFSIACTKSYLAAATDVSAFVFYLLDNATGTPPPANDMAWDLHDGGQWKASSQFPVYAIPGSYGTNLMQALAQYSGNMSQVKNGPALEKELDPTDYVRLYTTVGTGSPSNLPTLWAFLLIVLGVVVFLTLATSFSMHYIQRRGRRALQRRVDAGEVDLEALGFKRQRLSKEAIDALPQMTYTLDEKLPPLPVSDPLNQTPATFPTTATSIPRTLNPQSYDQPKCPICLDDYIPNETTVRSLPCHHIYHPECIDPFLLNNSTLCPVCKAKVPPPHDPATGKVHSGERITNMMVRRERRMRRLRESSEATAVQLAEIEILNADPTVSRWTLLRHRVPLPAPVARARFLVRGEPAGVTVIEGRAPTSSQLEMSEVGPGTGPAPEEGVAGATTSGWGEGRSRTRPSVDAEEEGGRQLGRLHRIARTVFPGFR